MAAPSQAILDNFNRANGALGANWASPNYQGDASPTVTSNAFGQSGTDYADANWAGATYTESEVYATLTAVPASGSVAYLHARIQSQGAAGFDAYELRVTKAAGTDTVDLYRIINNAETSLATRSQEVGAGDALGLVVLGTGATVTIQLWYRASGGSWAQLGADITDTSGSRITAAGRIGAGLQGNTARWDDFGGGTHTAGTTRNLTLAAASGSTTPDTAAVLLTRALTLAAASIATTPDAAMVLIAHALVLAAAGQSTTPDIANLSISGEINLTLVAASASITPDAAAIMLTRVLTLAATSGSLTPDIAAVLLTRALALAAASQSITPNTAALAFVRSLTLAAASQSSAGAAPWLVFGTSALRFYGTADNDIDRVAIPLTAAGDTVQTPVNVGAGDFTYELWIKCAYADNTTSVTDVRDSNIVLDRDIWNDSRGHVPLGVTRNGSNLVTIFGAHNGTGSWPAIRGTTNIGDGAWHHIAVVRNGSTIRIYVDGAQDASGTFSTANWSYPTGYTPTGGLRNDYLIIGTEKHDFNPGVNGFTGSIDELRISNIARYTANFTRPSAPFTPDADTVGLYHFDQGTGTVLGDSATIAGAPTNGELLIGGLDNGPTWQASSLFGLILTMAVASQSSTPDTAAILLTRALTVTAASVSTTPNTVTALITQALTLAAISASTTPDAVTALITHALTLAAAAQSSTPDTAAIVLTRALTLASASQSSTPDVATLLISHALIIGVASFSVTPDTANLTIGGAGVFTLNVTSLSSAPDTTAILLTHVLALATASQSSAPDTAALLLSIALAMAAPSASSTPDAIALEILVRVVLSMLSQSGTPDTVALAIARALSMIVPSLSDTPDDVVIVLERTLALAAGSQSLTPNDAELLLALASGRIRTTFALRQPGVSAALRQPGIDITLQED